MKKIKFYDTSSLLLKADSLFDEKEEFAISSITLKELENIKSSAHKDADIKYAARKLLHNLDSHLDKYQVVIFADELLEPFCGLEPNNDTKIMACGFSLKEEGTEIEFVTNDLCMKHLALMYFEKVSSVEDLEDDYLGYKEIKVSDEELEKFYSNPYDNIFNLLTNQYAVIYNKDDEVVDIRRWDGTEYKFLDAKPINSKHFGKINPQDIYQKMAFDSVRNNQLTIMRGKAGSGKSLIGLSYLFSLLESYRIDRLYILCNPVATRDAARLGLIIG